MLLSKELKNYLQNNTLILSEDYFIDNLKEKRNSKLTRNKKLFNDYILQQKKIEQDLIIEKTNYHLFYIHYFNEKYNSFLKKLDEIISLEMTKEHNTILENKILELKLKSKLIPFNLMYKIFFNENYLL